MTVLFILLMLIIFLTADFFVQRARARATVPAFGDQPYRIPAGVALAHNHTWLRHESGGVTTIGLDELLGKVVGSIERVVLPEVGASLTFAQSPIALSHGKKNLRVSAPVTGRIVAVNHELAGNPALLTTDPYGKGWMVKVQVEQRQKSRTLSGSEAVEWLRTQMEQVREFLIGRAPQAAHVMQDGGVITEGALRGFDQEVWDEFSRRFVALHPNAE